MIFYPDSAVDLSSNGRDAPLTGMNMKSAMQIYRMHWYEVKHEELYKKRGTWEWSRILPHILKVSKCVR